MRAIEILIVAATCTLLPACAPWARTGAQGGAASTRASAEVDLAGLAKTTQVVRDGDGRLYFEVRGEASRVLRLTPNEFAERLADQTAVRPWWVRVLNINSAQSLAWVFLGFVGQLLFTGRMVVQWVVSERRRESIVPTVFWWLSLAGSTLLVAYFGWRRDIVGVIGQAFGWVVYVRNLRLLAREGSQDRGAAA